MRTCLCLSLWAACILCAPAFAEQKKVNSPDPPKVAGTEKQKALDIFSKAEAAVADDETSLYRVRAEKYCVLFTDLNERNLGKRGQPGGRLLSFYDRGGTGRHANRILYFISGSSGI